jgi:hypothetical protein
MSELISARKRFRKMFSKSRILKASLPALFLAAALDAGDAEKAHLSNC